MRGFLLKLVAVTVVAFLAITLFFDSLTQRQTAELLASQTLTDNVHLLRTMRQIYRERIQGSNLPLTPESIMLCPGSVIGEMARRYVGSTDNRRGVVFGNVSDRPRNPANRADGEALRAIEHFRQHPETPELMLPVSVDGQHGLQFALPLWAEKPCLRCHGERDSSPAVVQTLFTEGFGYREGDLRGILFARMAVDDALSPALIHSRLGAAAVTALVLCLTLWLLFDQYLIRRLRQVVQGIRTLGEGRFQPLPLSPRQDEVDALIAGYNCAIQAVAEREADLADQAATIARQERFIKTVLESLDHPVLTIGLDYRVTMANRAAREHAAGRFLPGADNYCHAVIHNLAEPCPDAIRRCPLREVLTSGEQIHVTHVGQNCWGHSGIYDLDAAPLHDEAGRVCGIVESFHDVTDRVRNEAELLYSREVLTHIAYCDALTGLPNRRSFEEELSRAVQAAGNGGQAFTLMLLDLDGFKDVNDVLGHSVGDALLRGVGERLKDCVRRSDYVGRLAGDEFVVLVRQVTERPALERIAQAILTELQQPLVLSGQSVTVTTSIGIASYPADASSGEELVKAADIAMYSAKGAGRNRAHFFERTMDEAVNSRFALTRDLQAALAQQELFLEYQPQFAVGGTVLRGVEALMRWRSPQRGLVRPDEFIPILEESGLIRQSSDWLLNESLGQLRQWLDQGMDDIVMSINVSAREFEDETFADRLSAALARHCIAPALLELEITERMALGNLDHMLILLNRLRALGVRIAMDDFGTGYSSLSYLTRLPIDTLKIDRSFIRTLPASEKSRGVVRLIAGLGQVLGMEIVAEGIETEHELAHVAQAGCQVIQGFLYGRPQAPAAILALGGMGQNREGLTL